MRTLLVALSLLAPLGATEAFRIVAVERQGLPPFEDDRRIYRLEGAGQVSPGELLHLARPGEVRSLGRLRVVATTMDGLLAVLDRRGEAYPMKGDLALHASLGTVPRLPESESLNVVRDPQDPRLGIPRDPRTFREAIYFLPGDATLSPLGREKLADWARTWGPGRWTLELPVQKGLSEKVRQARRRVVEEALRHGGITGLQVRPVPPGPRPDALFVRFSEGEGPELPKAGGRPSAGHSALG